MKSNFYKDVAFGKLSEDEVEQYLISEGHDVVNVADQHIDYDFVIDNQIYLDVKNQKALANNEIVVELLNNYGTGPGWLMKDGKCNWYCFHLNDTCRFVFASKALLLRYISERPSEVKFYGQVVYIDVSKLYVFSNEGEFYSKHYFKF